MSHFTVLVIGEDVDEQLAPFSEELEVPEYLDEIVSDEDKKGFLEFYNENEGESAEPNIEEFPEYYKKYGEDWNSGSWRENEEGIWCHYSAYNPDAKWDWYIVGGRWTGFFKLKKINGVFPESKTGEPGLMTAPNEDPSRCDSTLKGNIDFDGMRNEAGDKARTRYRKVIGIVGDSLKDFKTWDELITPYTKEELHSFIDGIGISLIAGIRDKYHNQEARQKLVRNEDRDMLWINLDDYIIPEEEYVSNARRSAISTSAVLKDGVWYERGNMGWWGSITDEKDVAEWDMQLALLLESLPDDTLLTVVDCHI